jgi:hypothetical protein
MKFKSFKILKICSVIKIKFLSKNFCINILFCNHYFSPLNLFMKKGQDPDPDPNPKHTDPEHWFELFTGTEKGSWINVL